MMYGPFFLLAICKERTNEQKKMFNNIYHEPVNKSKLIQQIRSNPRSIKDTQPNFLWAPIRFHWFSARYFHFYVTFDEFPHRLILAISYKCALLAPSRKLWPIYFIDDALRHPNERLCLINTYLSAVLILLASSRHNKKVLRDQPTDRPIEWSRKLWNGNR